MFSSTAPELEFPGALCTELHCLQICAFFFFVRSLCASSLQLNLILQTLNSLILITQILLLLSAIVCVCFRASDYCPLCACACARQLAAAFSLHWQWRQMVLAD